MTHSRAKFIDYDYPNRYFDLMMRRIGNEIHSADTKHRLQIYPTAGASQPGLLNGWHIRDIRKRRPFLTLKVVPAATGLRLFVIENKGMPRRAFAVLKNNQPELRATARARLDAFIEKKIKPYLNPQFAP